MAETRRSIVLELVEPASGAVIDLLVKAGQVRLMADAQAGASAEGMGRCEVCEAAHPENRMPIHGELGRICIACSATADRLARTWKKAAARADREFRGQLKQMVLDVRTGAEWPTFYRGFE